MKLKIFFLFFIILGFVLTVNTQGLSQGPDSSVISAYRLYKDLDGLSIKVPTVVEVPFTGEFMERFHFAVVDKTTGLFQPYFFKQETLINEIPVLISTNPHINGSHLMNDGDPFTYTDFPLPENRQGLVQITMSSSKPITSSMLTVLLDNHVALPSFVEVRALVGGQNRIVVANRKMDEQTIHFPKTTSNNWTVTLTFGQPLRISELRLNQDNASQTSVRAVRFLAQPNHSYRIYFNPDRLAAPQVGESGNLEFAKGVQVVSAGKPQANPNYVISDVDVDGVPDIRDNCISVQNSDQLDVNNNGIGDVCEDFDQDWIDNLRDNCPNNPNRDQHDTDGDGIGDVCDQEESRLTERYVWIPWVGIGFAALVLIILLVLTARSTFTPEQNNKQ